MAVVAKFGNVSRFPLTWKVRELKKSGNFVGGRGKIACTARVSIYCCTCSIVSSQKRDDLFWIS